MEHLKFLENAREAAYCLLFNMGEFKGYAADLLALGIWRCFPGEPVGRCGMNTPAPCFRVLITYEDPTLHTDNEPTCITIGHDVCDTHAEAARRADDLLRQTPAAICASIRREVRR